MVCTCQTTMVLKKKSLSTLVDGVHLSNDHGIEKMSLSTLANGVHSLTLCWAVQICRMPTETINNHNTNKNHGCRFFNFNHRRLVSRRKHALRSSGRSFLRRLSPILGQLVCSCGNFGQLVAAANSVYSRPTWLQLQQRHFVERAFVVSSSHSTISHENPFCPFW